MRLTEADMHRLISESVRKALINEVGDTARGQYMLGRLAKRQEKRAKYGTPEYGGDTLGDTEKSIETTNRAAGERFRAYSDDEDKMRMAFSQGQDDEELGAPDELKRRNFERFRHFHDGK